MADTGPGLEESTRRHAFERFFTADGASGSGLGLAIAKELAERMDGGITLTRGPGGPSSASSCPRERGA